MLETAKERATNLDACIKCSACTAKCPVAAVYPLFPGPKSAGPDAERFRLEGIKFDYDCFSYCSDCKTCEATCPSGVHITGMIKRAKGKEEPGEFKSGSYRCVNLRHSIRDAVLGRAEYLGKLGTIWPGLTNFILKLGLTRWLLEKGLGLSQQSSLPAYSRKLPRQRGRLRSTNPKRVVYFPGCFITYNDAATGLLVEAILEHNGFEVIVPKFNCCGVPLEANGRLKQARGNIDKNLELMHAYLHEGIPVVTSCTTCGLALKEEYPKMLVPGGELIGAQTYDLFEFLWHLHERGELQEKFNNVSVAVGYHAPCHLKAQGIGTPAIRLIRLIPGVTAEEMDAGCCGLAGSFGYKKEKYPLAMEIGSVLFQRVCSGVSGGEFQEIITECGGCQLQIKHGTKIAARHPVWILAKAYGLIGEDGRSLKTC